MMVQTTKKQKMQLLRDLILVKPCPSDEQTEGGLFIPESARERSSRAVIVEVGSGTKREPMQYKKGDMVIHIKGAGDNEEFILGGETHYLIRQIDILSFVTNN